MFVQSELCVSVNAAQLPREDHFFDVVDCDPMRRAATQSGH